MRKVTAVNVVNVQLEPGRFWLAATDKGLCRLAFPNESKASFQSWIKRWCKADQVRERSARFASAIEQLSAYFDGKLKAFDLALDLRVTPFQRRVLQRVAQIPFGEITSYSQIAKELGDLKATRAVGSANGANPIPIIIPCHRVVGADGRLTGFGGGLPLKRKLLRLEGHHIVDNRLEIDSGQLTLFS